VNIRDLAEAQEPSWLASMSCG